MKGVGLVAVGTLFAAIGVNGCQSSTNLRLEISTNVASAPGTRVALYAATSRNLEDGEAPQALVDTWGTDGLVGTLAVIPAAGLEKSEVNVRIVLAVGRDPSTCTLSTPENQGCIVARRRILFVDNRSLTIPVRLLASCFGSLCSAQTTCVGSGICADARVDPIACAERNLCAVDESTASDAGGASDAQRSDGGAPTDGGGVAATGLTPCAYTFGVDPLSAWPAPGGCAYRSFSSRLAGPHGTAAPLSGGHALGARPGRLVFGRKYGSKLRVFASHASKLRALDFDGTTLTPVWSKSAVELTASTKLAVGDTYTLFAHTGSTLRAYDGETGTENALLNITASAAVPAENGDVIVRRRGAESNVDVSRYAPDGSQVWQRSLPSADDFGEIIRVPSGALATTFYVDGPNIAQVRVLAAATGADVRTYSTSYLGVFSAHAFGPMNLSYYGGYVSLYDDRTGENKTVIVDDDGVTQFAIKADLRSIWARSQNADSLITVADPILESSSMTVSGVPTTLQQPVMDADGWLFGIQSSPLSLRAYELSGTSYLARWTADLTPYGDTCDPTVVLADGQLFVVCYMASSPTTSAKFVAVHR